MKKILYLIIILIALTGCSENIDESIYEIELSEENKILLEEIKYPQFDDMDFFMDCLDTLEDKDKEYIIETVGKDSLYHFAVNSNLGVNEQLFVEKNIPILLELASNYKKNYESEMDYEEWYNTLEEYVTDSIQNVESTNEEFIEFINDYFEKLGYVPEFAQIEGDGKVITYNAFDWGDTARISFIKTDSVSEDFFQKMYGGYEYYTILLPVDAPFYEVVHNVPIFLSKSEKYIMFFENTGFIEADLHIIDTFCTLES